MLLFPLLLAACSKPVDSPAGDDGLGRLRLVLHDAPIDDVDAVWVQWGEVRVRHVVQGWITVSTAPGEVDLLTLQGGTTTVLGLGAVPVGVYDEVRMDLMDAWVIVDGERQPLSVPSGDTSGLKIKVDFTVEDCGDTSVSMDWDVGAHLTHNSQGFKLRPVLNAESSYDDASCAACSGEIEFPDPVLEAALRTRLGVPTGPITTANGPLPNYLYLHDEGITDLEGLQCFTAGTYLNLTGNPITDLSPIAGFTGLTVLYVRDTDVVDLTPVAGLTELRDLRIDRSPVADLAAIRGLEHLQIFSAIGVSVADWAPVTDLGALENLGVRSTNFNDLSLIAPGAPFRLLFANDSDIADLGPLAGRLPLEHLEVSRSPVSDLSPVYGLPNLLLVSVHLTQVSDLSGLDLPAVRTLDIGRIAVTDLTPLTGAPSVDRLAIRGAVATDYSVLTSLPALQNLDLTGATLACTDPVVATLLGNGVTVQGCP